jgi:hypothetical protein
VGFIISLIEPPLFVWMPLQQLVEAHFLFGGGKAPVPGLWDPRAGTRIVAGLRTRNKPGRLFGRPGSV